MTLIRNSYSKQKCLYSHLLHIENNELDAITEKRALEMLKTSARALLCAADKGYQKCIEALAFVGTNLEVVDDSGGKTAIMWAAQKGHGECINVLANRGALLEATSDTNHTPLFYAINYEKDVSVSALIDNGARVDSNLREKISAMGDRWAQLSEPKKHVYLALLRKPIPKNLYQLLLLCEQEKDTEWLDSVYDHLVACLKNFRNPKIGCATHKRALEKVVLFTKKASPQEIKSNDAKALTQYLEKEVIGDLPLIKHTEPDTESFLPNILYQALYESMAVPTLVDLASQYTWNLSHLAYLDFPASDIGENTSL